MLKVERPGSGDDARQWGQLFPDGRSSFYEALNRDKRGITVDLKDEAERTWLRRLCTSDADVVVQNLRPGTVERYGLGAAALRGENPRLVYCNLGAFGDRGPLRDRPGYDPLMQACGGIMSVTGEEGRPPVRVGTSIIDMGTGMWCAIGILAALNRRAATGRGCIVDASPVRDGDRLDDHPRCRGTGRGAQPRPPGLRRSRSRALPGLRMLGRIPRDRRTQRRPLRPSRVRLDHPEWLADERFDSNQKRYANLESLNRLLEPVFAQRNRE